jgi:hypothetical protein
MSEKNAFQTSAAKKNAHRPAAAPARVRDAAGGLLQI